MQLAIQKNGAIAPFFYALFRISCHRRHSIGARRYFMPPSALKSNLATTLRVLFYICSRLTASRIVFCRTRSTLACVIAKRVSSLTKAERQRHGVGAHILCACAKHTENDRRRYFMPPTALYRCSAVFHATCGTQKQPCDNATRFVFLYMLALDCKQSHGIYKKTTLRLFRKVVFSFGAGGRTRTDTDD